MKKSLSLLAILFFSVVTAVGAHQPLTIALAFNKSTQSLTATIIHPVSNPQTHYIFKVDVTRNGKEIAERKLDHQSNRDQEQVQFLLKDVKSGDTLAVEAFCNISGRYATSLIVE